MKTSRTAKKRSQPQPLVASTTLVAERDELKKQCKALVDTANQQCESITALRRSDGNLRGVISGQINIIEGLREQLSDLRHPSLPVRVWRFFCGTP